MSIAEMAIYAALGMIFLYIWLSLIYASAHSGG